MLYPPLPIHELTIHHRCQRTHCRRCNRRPNDRRWIYTTVLAPIGNDIDRNQLQRRDIQDQECAHFITGNALFSDRAWKRSASPVLFQLF